MRSSIAAANCSGFEQSTKLHRDAQLGQRVMEQVVRAAVQAGAADDVVARAGQVEDREGLGGLARGEAEGAHAALERGDALLEHAGGGVHDPGVDVPELLEPEQARRVGGIVEHVGRGRVDRHRARVGGGVRDLAGVQRLGLGVQVGKGVGIEAHCGSLRLIVGCGLRRGPQKGRARRLPVVCAGETKEPRTLRFAAPGPQLRDPAVTR